MRALRAFLLSVGLTVLSIYGLRTLQRTEELEKPPPARPRPGLGLVAEDCATCHRRRTPAVVQQWAGSVHARKRVLCSSCHAVAPDYPGAREHYGTYITRRVSSGICAECHKREYRENLQSRHALPAWMALVGYEGLTPELREQLGLVEEIRWRADRPRETGFPGAYRRAQYERATPEERALTCELCHALGKPNPDGSIGDCNTCHLRHAFSLAQARRPETCARCHSGVEHPHWKVYRESAHGVLYAVDGDNWNWFQLPGALDPRDFPAPTCQICHMSGFGGQPTTHDVGERLSWYLFAEVSERRPRWRENRERMKEICQECHARKFLRSFYARADRVTEIVNRWTRRIGVLLDFARARGRLTPEPLDDELELLAFDAWHRYAKTAKAAIWMNGPESLQSEGITWLRRIAKQMGGE